MWPNNNNIWKQLYTNKTGLKALIQTLPAFTVCSTASLIAKPNLSSLRCFSMFAAHKSIAVGFA